MASFAPEILATVGTFPITNTVVHTLVVDSLLISISLYVSRTIKTIPSFFQNTVESILESVLNLTDSIAHSAAQYIFPYVMSFFLFILTANLTSLLPGFGTIGFYEDVEGKKELIPILRGATSDINVTFALALVSVLATHMLSIKLTGIKDYVSRFFSLNPINLFVGMLELVSEITKVLSLSFRLFGNIFAGEFTLATVSKLFAFLFPLPFLLLETIVGLVQSLVFAILTLVFMAILTTPHHPQHEEVIHT
ncbi:MAG: hypothetical protein A3F31_01870 [Candidatus Levybacteria bacterium RIFCSPHIGHO2_12_FULL_38_12]|nr:MAG: hypothetical protein A2770_00755 [Candidatus Levybacteria bacterium RIFCSPHIGHO2_01_FULL_38_12]OGH22425.1 MAG: hypothetical protein A3D75_00075 [Candidatus Levybacteria bacterium RIFCSPHIGHO2_02_FULL_37_18]OGH23390.1 MAG: hypothetical protein A3F31_01870 [Candidatus Levybacteria bacterium RIFCSPHIGHO2_12_FULL_38_12]OGH34899.1 MAG: hypothetical protein A3A47_00450 [Candidatus Levybacteria bacterium RIFCSPLOWO2_01_FULL_37_20]OGH43641.1 MAG: hypothetical protein A3J14_02845 [Candidatus Lev